MERRVTPEWIRELAENEIFVFGSNIKGAHGGGAARIAYEKFGAEWGTGVGPTGRCYAIPTMEGGVDYVKGYVDEFTAYAAAHPDKVFLVTRIGCGIAGFKVSEIAPLFDAAYDLENVALPEDFIEIISEERHRTAAALATDIGLSDINRFLRGGDPFPPKREIATKESWNTSPMPARHTSVKLAIKILNEDMDNIEMGHIPDDMGDKWFMYCEDGHIRWYRSWSGFNIFDAEYERSGECALISRLTINRSSEEYDSRDKEADVYLFLTLMAREIGADAEVYWKNYLSKKK